MSIRIVNAPLEKSVCEVGKLKYGTILSGIPSHPDAIYMKVDKNSGAGCDIKGPTTNKSLLVNLSSGTMRLVPGNQNVVVYEGELKIRKVENALCHVKDRYMNDFI